MDRASMKTWVVLASVIASSLTIPVEAEACFLDRFRRRRQATTTAFYPTTTAPAAAACGAAYCEQTVLRYVPQVAYRTVWQPVPVTTYRRTVSYNPANGLPITCTQPCTSYTYQARRVPYTTFRPVYTQVPVTNAATGCNSCQTATAPAATATPYYQATPSASIVSPGVTSSTVVVPQAVSPSPTSDPAGATPWEPIQQTPTQASPIPGNSPPATTDPADDRPRIDPQAGEFSSLQRIPSTAPRNTYSITPSNADRAVARSDPFNRKVPSSTQTTWTSDASQPDIQPSTRITQPRTLNIRPIPRIEDYPQESDFEAPPLLNQPRDNTALIRPIPTQWASNRIQWSERQVSHAVPVGEAEPTRTPGAARRLDRHRIQHQDQTPAWDDTGWRSAQR